MGKHIAQLLYACWILCIRVCDLHICCLETIVASFNPGLGGVVEFSCQGAGRTTPGRERNRDKRDSSKWTLALHSNSTIIILQFHRCFEYEQTRSILVPWNNFSFPRLNSGRNSFDEESEVNFCYFSLYCVGLCACLRRKAIAKRNVLHEDKRARPLIGAASDPLVWV